MKIAKFFRITTAILACVFAVSVISYDDNDKPKTPELKCSPAKVEVASGSNATVTVSGGTTPFTVVSGNNKIVTAKADKNVVTVSGVKDNETGTISVTTK